MSSARPSRPYNPRRLPLSPGTRLGAYEVAAQIGEGGMGQVYRATDTRLKRQVAIKILPSSLAADHDRLARFQREAEVLASLSHPNIAAIYGLEESGGMSALVMELIEGVDLSQRIARGAIPLNEALTIARQIAEALDAAHEKGIVHRDLKPANIKITPDGVVKVLDFGLAKAVSGNAATADLTQSPTIAVSGTRDGVILGTAPYMSPEQARGQTVDKRTDIWAFGCVLYEMITGCSAFERETITDTLAAIVERDPDWLLLPASIPGNIRRLLRRCLEKDLKRRCRDIGDARADLADLDATLIRESSLRPNTSQRATRTQRRWRVLSLVAGAIAAVALSAFVLTTGSASGLNALDASAYRFTPLATEPADETSPSWSPDGKSIAYVAEIDGVRQVFTRALSSAGSTQITKSPTDCQAPFWSPDGARVYFISFDPSTGNGRLWSVGATGGEPQVVLTDVAAAAVAPDGKTLAFLRGPGGSRSLWTSSLATPDPQQYRTPPFPETFGLSYSVEFSRDGTRIGVLVRRREGAEGASYTSELWIIPYPTGTPRRVLERIPEAAESRLTWAPDNRHIVWDSVFPDRVGRHLYVADTERATIRQITSGTVNEQSPSLSPDGKTIAFAAGSDDVNLIGVPLDGSAVQTLLASARSENWPTWSANGSQLAYVTNAQGAPEIWVRSVREGWTRPIVKRDSENPGWVNLARPSYSPDGQRIVYEVWGTKHAVWVASAADGRGVPLDPESPDQHSPAWSPDGKWIAYQRISGTSWDLVKVPSGGGTPVRIGEATPGGGEHTAWSPAGDWIAHVQRGALQLTSPYGLPQKTLKGSPPAVFGFSSDGSLVYAVRHASNGNWVLVAYDVRTEQERSVTDLNLPPRATLSGFSLHPNGKSFATGIGIARHDIWLLGGFELPSRWFDRFRSSLS